MQIILASSSPRRKELMDLAKIEYEVNTSNFDENVNKEMTLEEQSIEIAYGKAKEVFNRTQGNRCVIGADTLVIFNEEQLGKAKSREEAIEMIKKIQGNSHEVFTSIAVLIEENGKYKEYKEIYKTKVFVKKMTNAEIENYIDNEQPYDCAGAYKIQEYFAVFVEKIEGDYFTIIGFPINRIYTILKDNKIL